MIVELDNFAFAIEPASSAFATPPSFMVTAPDDTAKLSELKDATPLLDVVASSPAIVISSSLTVVSIPSPPENVRVPPVEKVSLLPLSAARVREVLIDVEPPNATVSPLIVRDEFANLLFAIEPAS